MKKTIVAASLALLAMGGVSALAQADIRQEQVNFERGKGSATVKGSLKGDQTVDYRLRAAGGQTMEVSLEASNASTYFNVLPPGDETALFVGSTSGNSFVGTLPKDGEYTVRLYLMRNAARRNESTRYTLNFTIAGSKAVSGTSPAAPPAVYDASGKIKCSTGTPTLDQWCDFRVVRNLPASSAQIWIAHASEARYRVLHFAKKRFTTDDGAGITARRQDDNWQVDAGGKEFYLIPDALIHGG